MKTSFFIQYFVYLSVVWGYEYPFRNPDLSWSDRVDDLVSRLTLEEVVDQMTTYYQAKGSDVARLGIKPYQWITECLHGERSVNATAFPHSLGLAAAFRQVICCFETISELICVPYFEYNTIE